MQDFLTLAQKRYSVRSFTERKLTEAELASLLEAARLAPTAKNTQDFHIYVLQSEEAMQKANACSPCIYGAPQALLVCCDRRPGGVTIPINSVDFPLTDAAIVMTHLALEAAELGLGSCWVGYFDEAKTKAAFELPEFRQPIGFLPVGEAAVGPGEGHTASRDLSELFTCC